MNLELTADRLKLLHLWVLTPCAGGVMTVPYQNSVDQLSATCRRIGLACNLVRLPNDSAIARARNNLADIFMAESSDPENHYSLWIDADIQFTAEDILALIAIDRDVTAIPYSRKGIHWGRVAAAARLNWPDAKIAQVAGDPNCNWLVHPIRLNEPMPIQEAGNGGLLVKRKVYQQLQSAYPRSRYRRTNDETACYGNRRHAWAYFQEAIDDWDQLPDDQREFLTEDWWFCRHWLRMGGTIWGCFWMKTNHYGPYHYPLDMPAISDLLAATGGSLQETYVNVNRSGTAENQRSGQTEVAESETATR